MTWLILTLVTALAVTGAVTFDERRWPISIGCIVAAIYVLSMLDLAGQ